MPFFKMQIGKLKLATIDDVIKQGNPNKTLEENISDWEKRFGVCFLFFSKESWKEKLMRYKNRERQIRLKEKKASIKDVCNLEKFETIWHFWSQSVKERNGGLCWCGNKAQDAHHIFYKSYYPKLALSHNNGIGLCKKHHYEVHGQRLKKWK